MYIDNEERASGMPHIHMEEKQTRPPIGELRKLGAFQAIGFR